MCESCLKSFFREKNPQKVPAINFLQSWTKMMKNFSSLDVTNSWTRRRLHKSLRKLKESRASFNVLLTWYRGARKPQPEIKDKLQDLKLLWNFVRTEEVEIPSPV